MGRATRSKCVKERETRTPKDEGTHVKTNYVRRSSASRWRGLIFLFCYLLVICFYKHDGFFFLFVFEKKNKFDDFDIWSFCLSCVLSFSLSHSHSLTRAHLIILICIILFLSLSRSLLRLCAANKTTRQPNTRTFVLLASDVRRAGL